jgi:hypothetical protein
MNEVWDEQMWQGEKEKNQNPSSNVVLSYSKAINAQCSVRK